MAAAAAFAGVAALQVWSGLQQAQMMRRQAKLTEQLNEMNARFAEIDAYEEEKFGYSEAAAYQTQIDATVGQQRVAFAAQGVDVSFGTAAQLQAETRLTGFLNTIDIQNQARAKARGLRNEAANIRLGSYMGRSQAEINASAAQTQGILGAVNTGVTAVSGYARK